MHPLSVQQIMQMIFVVRGLRVMFDSDLAVLYGVETKNLNKAVRRNIGRFPEDFMFQLSPEEFEILRFQIGTSSLDPKAASHGGRRHPPLVFTEQGVAMLSSVLRSEEAMKVNIEIMRTFVKLREVLLTNRDLAQKLEKLEKKYDSQFKAVFDAIRELMVPPEPKRRTMGFHADNDE